MWIQEEAYEYKESSHSKEYCHIIGERLIQISREFIMSELNNGDFNLILHKCNTISPVTDLKLIYSKFLRNSKLCLIDTASFCRLLKWDVIVGIEHNELQVYFLGHKRFPCSIWLLIQNINIKFNIVFDAIIFWIDSTPFRSFFVVSHSNNFNDSFLFWNPKCRFFAEVIISRSLRFVWIC